jgi:DNA-binding HxlR family transcriptional regulator
MLEEASRRNKRKTTSTYEVAETPRERYFPHMAREKGYGQFCPVARAAEILTERWVPLIVRKLLCGSVRFNDLQRGVPRMSPALLSKRLKELEFSGIVQSRPVAKGRGSEYRLTKAGEELFPILEGMGLWAQRWVRDDLVASENLDPDLLMWDIRRNVAAEKLADNRRFVVRFEFSGVPVNRRRYWLVFDRVKDPGFDPDLFVTAPIKTLVEVWLGHVSIAQAARSERLGLDGTRDDVRKFKDWFTLSIFAKAGRKLPGKSAASPAA